MATPDIGTTISEGYSRGLDRVGPLAGAAVVPALAMGAVAFVVSLVQAQFRPDTLDEAVNAILSGNLSGATFTDRLVINGLGAVQSIVLVLLGTGLSAVLAGALHRERNGGVLDLPSPGGSLPAVIAVIPNLMPKVMLLALLGVAGTLASVINGALGGFVSLVAGLVSIWLSIRWIYAAVVVGSGEATGDAAYERSDEVVAGSWWPTLGIWIVVGLAIGLPIGIAAAIVGAVLGAINAYIGALALFAVALVGFSVVGPAALESAWNQVKGDGGDGPGEPGQQLPPAAQQPPTDPAPPTNDGPFV